MFIKIQPAFYDSINALHGRMKYICDSAYDPKRFPELQEEDVFKLHDDVEGHYLNRFSEYYTIWQAKLYANEVRENGGRPKVWPPKHVMDRVMSESMDQAVSSGEESQGDKKEDVGK